jgi:ActR/RegA family two-component response regulator
MGEQKVIIADGDTRYRNQVTGFFKRDGYRVETADSIEQILANVQEGQPQVLLLGSAFSTKIAASDLIRLLKKCSRQLHIIMVSDGMTLAQNRQVRQEGVFYLALKPAAPNDTEELGEAVACAFDRQRASVLSDPAVSPQGQSDWFKAAEKFGFSRMPSPKNVARCVGICAALVGAGFYSLAEAAEKAADGRGLAAMIFLCFCALLVVGQLLPIFRIRPASARSAERSAREYAPARELVPPPVTF